MVVSAIGAPHPSPLRSHWKSVWVTPLLQRVLAVEPECHAWSCPEHIEPGFCHRNPPGGFGLFSPSAAQMCPAGREALQSRRDLALPSGFSGYAHCGCCLSHCPSVHVLDSPDVCPVPFPGTARSQLWLVV